MMTKIIFFILLFIPHSSPRRLLHQPFFPATDPPPPPTTAQPPSLSPSPQPQPLPKHPFSSLTQPSTTGHHHRFFPFYTNPPSSTTTTTVPSTSLPTFPANISSIILPSSSPSSSSKSHVSGKFLLISLTLSILSIAFIATVVASLLYHRNHHKPPTSDSLRLFPANHPTSDKPPPPPTPPSNFTTTTNAGTSVSGDNYDTMDSPELRPLPPLPRREFLHQHNRNSGSFADSDEEDHDHKTESTAPAPPPAPALPGFWEAGKKEDILKPKLKGLHWDKVRGSSEKAMVWDQLKFSTFQLNEEMIETLFVARSSKVGPNHSSSTNQPMVNPMATADMNQKSSRGLGVFDPHKSRNIAILLRAFNLTIDEVCESILQGNVDTLGSELLGSLLKMAPTMEEEVLLKELNELVDPSEKFLKAVIDIPFAFKRVDAMLYISNFDAEVEYLMGSFDTIESACQQLRNTKMFIKLLEAVLVAGNRMNIGTNRGDARAFKLDTLLKLIDIKGTDGKTTLLHFVVKEITRAEGLCLSGSDHQNSELCDEVDFTKRGLEVVSGLGSELSSVKKAATMDFGLLSNEVGKLTMGLTKIREVVSLNERFGSNKKFSDSMDAFLKKAEDDMVEVEGKERVSVSLVKETTEYFHGNLTMEESQPLRIFIVVRDFLSVLDRVCKEVGKINKRTTVGSCGPMSQSLPSVFPRFNGQDHFGSFDGEDDSTTG